ncbi:MAG: outer membrane beta-barrel protein [Proteobacteria bacterium]|nr:outer membrane beta-barrel protein [Pseudomonadota bacterium]
MTKQFLTVAAAGAAMVAAMPLAAHADQWGGAEWANDGIYVRGEGGWTNLDDNHFNTTGGQVNTKYKEGYNVGAAVGTKSGAWRYEVEGIHQEADVKTNSGLPGSGGTSKMTAAMGNVYYDIGNGRLKPYVGGGVGMADVKLDNYTGGGATLMDDSDTVLAYQGMAGVSYQLNPCWAINAEYRYVGTNDAELTSASGTTSKVAYDSNNVLLGLTYKF